MASILGSFHLAETPSYFDWVRSTHAWEHGGEQHLDLSAWDGSPISLTIAEPEWSGATGFLVRPPATAQFLDDLVAPFAGRVESVQLVGTNPGADVYLLGTVPEPSCLALACWLALAWVWARRR